jgi:5-methylcytosine-specific restriction endonuclease McrA
MTRLSARARGYDEHWRKFRAPFLQAHPFCCEKGCSLPANEVDHIISVREAPELRLVHFNCRAFCKPHHSARTARDESIARSRGGRGIKFFVALTPLPRGPHARIRKIQNFFFHCD